MVILAPEQTAGYISNDCFLLFANGFLLFSNLRLQPQLPIRLTSTSNFLLLYAFKGLYRTCNRNLIIK
jgi:hypothetical protein